MLRITSRLLQVPIVQVLIHYGVKVPNTGHHHGGERVSINCPFHEETKPSFMIYLEQNNAYCFGCGKKYDGVGLIREFEQCRFTEAMHKLAFVGGFVIPTEVAQEARQELQGTRQKQSSPKQVNYYIDIKFQMVSEFTTWLNKLPKRRKFYHLTDAFFDVIETIGEETMGRRELDEVKDLLLWGRKFFEEISWGWLLFRPKPPREAWGERVDEDLGSDFVGNW